MAEWTYASGHGLGERRGLYVLRRDDNEVGTVALLDDVENHHARMIQICAAMTVVDELIADEP